MVWGSSLLSCCCKPSGSSSHRDTDAVQALFARPIPVLPQGLMFYTLISNINGLPKHVEVNPFTSFSVVLQNKRDSLHNDYTMKLYNTILFLDQWNGSAVTQIFPACALSRIILVIADCLFHRDTVVPQKLVESTSHINNPHHPPTPTPFCWDTHARTQAGIALLWDEEHRRWGSHCSQFTWKLRVLGILYFSLAVVWISAKMSSCWNYWCLNAVWTAWSAQHWWF